MIDLENASLEIKFSKDDKITFNKIESLTISKNSIEVVANEYQFKIMLDFIEHYEIIQK